MGGNVVIDFYTKNASVTWLFLGKLFEKEFLFWILEEGLYGRGDALQGGATMHTMGTGQTLCGIWTATTNKGPLDKW